MNAWYAEVLANESIADMVHTENAVLEIRADHDRRATEVSENLTLSELGIEPVQASRAINSGELPLLAAHQCQSFLPLNHQVCGAILQKYVSMGDRLVGCCGLPAVN